jgi:hypothetical protein
MIYLSTSIRTVSSIFVHTIADLAGSEEIQPAPSVVHCKVIRYFRFGWCARAYAAIASIVATVALNGISSFDAIQNLFSTLSLPLPIGT